MFTPVCQLRTKKPRPPKAHYYKQKEHNLDLVHFTLCAANEKKENHCWGNSVSPLTAADSTVCMTKAFRRSLNHNIPFRGITNTQCINAKIHTNQRQESRRKCFFWTHTYFNSHSSATTWRAAQNMAVSETNRVLCLRRLLRVRAQQECL